MVSSEALVHEQPGSGLTVVCRASLSGPVSAPVPMMTPPAQAVLRPPREGLTSHSLQTGELGEPSQERSLPDMSLSLPNGMPGPAWKCSFTVLGLALLHPRKCKAS